MAKELVAKSNSLLNASYYLDLGEYRLITASVAIARKTGVGISAEKPLTISTAEFASLYDLDRTTAYKTLRAACDTLFERQISYLETLDGKKMIARTRWVQTIMYSPEENNVALVFSSSVAPHIADLSKDFTTYYIENIKNLKSPYAVRLYEQLARWKNAGQTPDIEPDELKRLMGVEKHLYTRSDVFKKLLNSCLDKINEHTDLQVTYQQKKQGRFIKAFQFIIEIRDSVKEPVSPTNIRLTPGQRDSYARKLVDAMAGNRDINKRLCRFPESQISSFALQVAVSNALSKPETVVEFLPLLKQVGF
jgi:plasmid replication initiation protein